METFIKGDIVVVPFPFSDLSASKKRPALVLANLDGDDIILCQITSSAKRDLYCVALNKNQLTSGNLQIDSFIRPNRIFTSDKALILYKLGTIEKKIFAKVVEQLHEIIKNSD